jgi:predicted RNA methylase
VGVKHRQGAYFTPPTVVDRLINETLIKPGTFLDPCCGSGGFVVAALQQLNRLKDSHYAHKVFGIDIDPLAVLICRASLTLASMGKANSLEQIRIADSLTTNPFNQKFDYIVTNPPWGASLPPTIDSHFRHAHSESRNQRQTFDSFGYFLLKLPVYLLAKGSFSFVLPAAFASVKRHRELRHFLVTHFSDVQLQEIPEKFSGVLTSSVSVRGCLKSKTSPDVIYSKDPAESDLAQKDSLKDTETALPIGLSRRDLKVIEMMEKHPLRLKNQSKFALGIVTGNNQKYLQDEPQPNCHEIIRGRDIQPFQILPKKQIYICLDSGLQQVAPLNCYLANPKLVYRFISDRFIFAIDRQQRLTLNSANVLIPFMEGYSLEALCGIFNSDLARIYFQKKYSSLKVLKQHLENFPLPSCTGKSQLIKKVSKLVLQLETQNPQLDHLTSQIDEAVYELYGIPKRRYANTNE